MLKGERPAGRILHVGPKGWEAKQRVSQGAGLEQSEAGESVPGLSLPGLPLPTRHPMLHLTIHMFI